MLQAMRVIHGGNGFGERNTEGERILEFSAAHNLVVANSFFKKRLSHIITYSSGNCESQIDYFLVKKRDWKLIRDVKVIPGEECAPQHKLLVSDMSIAIPPIIRRKFVPRCRIWKLRNADNKADFEQHFLSKIGDQLIQEGSVNSVWSNLKSCLLHTADAVCGRTKNHRWHKETWWWNHEIDHLVKEKRKAWKVWKAGGSREDYNLKKKAAKRAIYLAKRAKEEEKFACLEEKPAELFRIARQMKQDNQDVVGEKCVLNDEGAMTFSDSARKKAWHQHYETLLNVEFPWERENLPLAEPVQGPAPYISRELVADAVKRLKYGKAAGPSGVSGELLRAAGDTGIDIQHVLVNNIIKDCEIPTDWEESYILSLYKGKGSALERGNYRGLKLLEHAMKVVERIIEGFIRRVADIDAMQFGFMP